MKTCAPAGEFEYAKWGKDGLSDMAPLWMLKYLPNMPASHIAIYNDLRGPNNSLTMREAAGNLAIGEAFRTIQRGHANMMVAGATGTRYYADASDSRSCRPSRWRPRIAIQTES